MTKKRTILATFAGVILLGILTVGPIMSNIETPDYEVLVSEANIEIRQYQPMIIAEVSVAGERRDAISDGFRLLADYIFGNNTQAKGIEMTAPVQQEGAKIEMTAPVQQEPKGNFWQISFVMPSEYSIETLPKPNDERVSIREIPAKQFVVITFSGMNTDKNVKKYEKELMEFVKAKKLSVSGEPKYAFYNPPWTLPMMRRNEVMVEIQKKD